jgi:AbiV family abortive infection protein
MPLQLRGHLELESVSMSTMVKSDFVIEGLARAALNAKRFIEDALFLYHAKRLGSASIISVISLENVGRARRMLQQVLDTLDPVTNQFQIRAEIDKDAFLDSIRSNHKTEIRAGTVGLQFAASSPVDMSEFNQRIQELQQFPKEAPEHFEILKKVKRSLGKVFNKTTTDFHLTRTIEQYIEPDDACTAWNEPHDAQEQRVRDLIVNTTNNYNFLVAQITGNNQMIETLRVKGLADH